MKKYILSIDGGGIRGIIPAVILSTIEERTKLSISEIFDFITGTSTGGIIAAGLCKRSIDNKPQYSAKDLLELYKQYGAYIFHSSILRKIFSWLYSSEYSTRRIEKVLRKYFDNSLLKSSLKPLLLSTYDIYNNNPFFLKSWKEDRNFITIRDALRASTAAPTYFPPKSLKVGSQELVLIDGGIFATNPASYAYSCAKRLFAKEDRIIILSLGTGLSEKKITYNQARKFGKIEWIKPLIDNIFNSSLDLVDSQMQELIGKDYIRIQAELKVSSHNMDNAEKSNINHLIEEAQLIIKKHKKIIDNFCYLLS